MNKLEIEEINLLELMVYVLKRWRRILAATLAAALVLCLGQYVMQLTRSGGGIAGDTEQLRQIAESPVSLEEKAALISEDLTPEKIEYVSSIVHLEELYDAQVDYRQHALLMKIDPQKVAVERLQYWVDIGSSGKENIAQGIIAAYTNQIYDSAWKKLAMEAAGEETDPEYLSELISVENSGDFSSQSFTVVIQYYDREKLAAIADVIKKTLQESNAGKKLGTHRLVLLNESVGETVDLNLYTRQQERTDVILRLESSINAYKTTLDTNQNKLYQASSLRNFEKAYGKEAVKTVRSVPRPHLKFALIGAVVGLFLSCMYYAFLCVFSDRLRAVYSINQGLRIPLLGEIRETKKKKSLPLFEKLDCWLDRLSHSGSESQNIQQRTEMMAVDIALYCESNGMKDICLTSSSSYNGASVGMLKDALQNRGLQVAKLDAMMQNSDALEAAGHAGGILMVEQAGKSRYSDILNTVDFCRKHDKKIIGLVIVS